MLRDIALTFKPLYECTVHFLFSYKPHVRLYTNLIKSVYVYLTSISYAYGGDFTDNVVGGLTVCSTTALIDYDLWIMFIF